MYYTLLSRLFGSEERALRVKSNDRWTSLAAEVPCVTMAVRSFKADLITSGRFAGFKHEYSMFRWLSRTLCTIDIPVLEERWLSSAVDNKILSKISRHVWIYNKKEGALSESEEAIKNNSIKKEPCNIILCPYISTLPQAGKDCVDLLLKFWKPPETLLLPWRWFPLIPCLVIHLGHSKAFSNLTKPNRSNKKL